IVVGTYSSIFVAAPILLYLEQRFGGGAQDVKSSGKPGPGGGKKLRARAGAAEPASDGSRGTAPGGFQGNQCVSREDPRAPAGSPPACGQRRDQVATPLPGRGRMRPDAR